MAEGGDSRDEVAGVVLGAVVVDGLRERTLYCHTSH